MTRPRCAPTIRDLNEIGIEATNAPNRDASKTTAISVCVAAVIAGTILRIATMGGDLAFDEVWSILWARRLDSPFGIVTGIHLDNNHYLNTLTMWLLLPLDWHAAYRIPSVVASVATIGLAGVYGARYSRTAAVTCSLLHAFSFFLIQYGTEARGYALVVLVIVAAMIVLEMGLSDPSPRILLLFSALTGVGLLAHLTFVLFAVPALAVLAFRVARVGTDRASIFVRLIALGAMPSVLLGLLWWFDLRHLRIAGGPSSSALASITQLAALVVGVWHGPFLGVAALGACGLLLLLLATPSTRSNQQTLLLIAGAALLLAIALMPRQMAYSRYFLAPFELVLLSIGRSLAATLRSASHRWLGLACLLVIVSMNCVAVFDLASTGRGHYRRAMAYIAASSHGETLRVGSDHDLRNGAIFSFYAPRIPNGDRLSYQPGALQAGPKPDWLIFHETEVNGPAPPELIEVRGIRYRLDHSEWHAGLSGFTWHLYRRSS